MDIHSIYRFIFRFWRRKRMAQFESTIQPGENELVLDVGGYPQTWTAQPQVSKRVDCLNLHQVSWDVSQSPNHRITTTVGDGCSLAYDDGAYDIVYSNSVIEHVGDWEKQQAFAKEIRRVGKRLWIQTPAYECPIEPHFIAPFVHWIPISVRRHLLRWFTLWGWLTKPSQETIDETIAFTQLLRKKQFQELFPDCDIITERLLGVFPKSYIAYRIHCDPAFGFDNRSPASS